MGAQGMPEGAGEEALNGADNLTTGGQAARRQKGTRKQSQRRLCRHGVGPPTQHVAVVACQRVAAHRRGALPHIKLPHGAVLAGRQEEVC